MQPTVKTGFPVEVIENLTSLLATDIPLNEGVQLVCDYCSQTLKSTVVLAYQYQKAADIISLIGSVNLNPNLMRSVSTFHIHRNEGGILNSCLSAKDVVLSRNVDEAPICLEFMEEIQAKRLSSAVVLPVGIGNEPRFLFSLFFNSENSPAFVDESQLQFVASHLSVLISRLEMKDKLEILEKQVHVDRKIINQKSTDIQKKGEQLDNIDTKLRRVVEVMLSGSRDQETLMKDTFKVVSDLLNMETIGMGHSSGDFLVLEYIYDKENILRQGDQFPSLDHFKVTVKGGGHNQDMDMKNPFTMKKYVNHPVYQHLGFSTFFSTPILINQVPYGTLFAASKFVKTISMFEEDMLYFLAHKLAFELEKRQMENKIYEHSKELERSNQELKTINLLGQAITSVLDQGALLKTILKSLVQASECEDASLFLYDDSTDELIISMVASEANKSIEGFRMPSTKGIAGWVFTNRHSQIVNNTGTDKRHDKGVDKILQHRTDSILCTPIIGPDNMIYGVVQLINKLDENGYVQRDLEYMEMLMPFISIALKNAKLFTMEQETTRKAQQAQALKSEFLSNMSHELRTPLTSIIAYTDILLRDYETFNDRQKKSVDRIKMSSKHLLNLINDILDLSKIEAGMMNIHKSEVDLAMIIYSAVSTFELQTQQKGIQLNVTPPESRVVLLTDEIRVKQVLINLVSNALKFTDEGGIFITFGELSEQQVFISVKDTGTGIPDESKELIFESFRQADGSASRKAGGTGLGLSISQKLATLLGGRLELESEVGVGSTFTLLLPYDRGLI
ncbi:MAG: GAF domain-containing sensor histidine kinase [Bacteroidetes bacterium]|nr:GAF domain-containing sensor histidine kinase [Bacteroidota bacterium]